MISGYYMTVHRESRGGLQNGPRRTGENLGIRALMKTPITSDIPRMRFAIRRTLIRPAPITPSFPQL